MKFCIIIPTYNNEATLYDVVSRALSVCRDVIVVNDGSTDNTIDVLLSLREAVRIISYTPNKGKGYALRYGFREARGKGYDYAITLDADGQHRPEEIHKLLAAVDWKSGNDEKVLAVGCRNLNAAGIPVSNIFANRFSNFWFCLQTGIRLPDTQTGYRLYPLRHLPCLGILTNRYESELELLVLSAWRGVRLKPIPVSVSYPKDRVSHFRPFADFFRISILNTCLCFFAVVYGYPRILFNKLKGGKQ